MISVHFQGKPLNITVIQVFVLTSNAEVERFYEDLQDLLELTPKKDVLFIIGDWNAKVGSQEIPGVTQNSPWHTEWGREKANRVLPKEYTGHSKHPFPNTRENSTHGHHQMVNTEIRLIIFFAAKMGMVYAVSKMELTVQELTVAQIMNSLLPNSDLNWRKWGKPLDHSATT